MRKTVAIGAGVGLLWGGRLLGQGKEKKGEETTRSVAGIVTNADAAPAPGADVQFKNIKTLQIRSFIAKEDGAYYFHELSPDVDYEVKADLQGASSGSKTLSSFDSRKKATINLK